MTSPGGVPPFAHDAPGTPAGSWRAHPRWAAGAPLGLAGVRRVVAVAAHPDDESLGAGGLLSAARAQGLEVVIVCVTDGEGSHPRSLTHPPAVLAARRAAEALAAAAELGVDEQHLVRLSLPDGGVEGREADVTRAVVAALGDGRDAVVVAPWRQDGHPDHEAAGRAAAAAARRTGAELWEYPVWFWHWADVDQAPWGLLRPFALEPAARRAKDCAVRAHASQVAPLSRLAGDEALLGADLLAHFADGPEHYLCSPAATCPDDALELLHRASSDPWGVESRWYERRKRDLTLAMLPRERFRRALEVGCSTGALAATLRARCDQVVAADRSSAAVASARQRLDGDAGAEVALLDLPAQWPEGSFDLVVVSEVGYFLSPGDLEQLVRRTTESLTADGVVLLCHWRHPVEGWVLDAEAVHAGFLVPAMPPRTATYQDRDVLIHVHARGWPGPGE